MRKVIYFAIGIFISISLNAQLVNWQLTVDGQPTINNPQLYAGNFSGGASVSISYGSSGAYSSGWPTGAATADDYYQIVLAPDTGYKLTITALNFSERRSLSGIRNYEVRYSTDSTFASYSVLASVTVPDDDAECDGSVTGLNLFVNSGDTLYIRWYGYNAESSAGTWRINDNSLSIDGALSVANANDINSTVLPPVTQVSGGTISSLVTAQTNAVPVFSFRIKDSGATDGKPTYVTYLTIANPHPAGEASWLSHIQGAVLNDGTQNITVTNLSINDNQMTFLIDSGNLVVPDGGEITITMSIYLNAGGLTDNGVLQFKIDSVNQGFDAALGGSGFAADFGQTIESNLFTIDVQATKLILSNVPYTVWQSADFQTNVEAVDSYQNRDVDNTASITISQVNGTGNLTSLTGLSQLLIQGQYTWTDLQYDGVDNFQLKVSDNASVLTDAYSSTIYVSQAYDTIIDDFSDNDISVNPTWLGNTGAFITSATTNPQLELFTYTGSADTAYLVTPFNNQYDSVEWQMKVHLAFDPSDNNYARFYLVADNNDLKSASNSGFYLQFGENGTNDAITLYHQTSLGNVEMICRGTDAAIASSPDCRVKVIYTKATHQWRLYADHTGQSNFLQEATGTDTVTSFPAAHYVGIFTRYTTTNDEGKMFFDDVYAGPVQIDTVPPALSLVRVVDSLHLDVIFSEGIMPVQANNTSNYQINNGVGTPISVQQDSVDISLLHLALANPLVDKMTYQMTVTQVNDFSGNSGNNLISTFTYYLPKFNDIVVNEIMADPSPAVGLPEYEYLELFNNSAYDIDITNWTITVGTKTKTISDFVMSADSFLIITSDDGLAPLSIYGNAISLLGSSDLTNSGQTIVLRNVKGQVISAVTYDDSWYKNSYKAEGGWSLERIDPTNACEGYGNWKASNDNSGGTPGRINSVYAANADVVSPRVVRATVLSDDTIMVYFSEAMDSVDLSDTQIYAVDYSLGHPSYALPVGPDYKKVLLGFPQHFSPITLYTLTVDENISDCAGNTLGANNSCQFAIPSLASAGDIVINEVLYNPKDNGVDYVELYNNSTRTIDLQTLKLANRDETDTANVKNVCDIAPDGYLFFPASFVLLSTDGNKVLQQYYSPNPDVFLDMADFPSLPNDNGNILLMDTWMNTIDYFEYSDDMQFPLLNSSDGVSLERINYTCETNDANSWHSAAFSVGYGTPGYKNSQYLEENDGTDEFTLSTDIFSPDNDGYQDILEITYQLPSPNYTANIIVYDAKGRKIKRLAQNELLGTNGTFSWNGLNESNEKVRPGIYIILIEAFDLDGNVKHYKKNVVVAYKY